MQLKYLFHDYVIKKPYKEIKFFGEFQQELLYAIPYAYWHYKNGTLKKTISSKYTRELYFFSPEHIESFNYRRWLGNYTLDIPHGPHNHKICKFRWKPVPYKETFFNNIFVFKKPLLIVANRYNTEWNQPPISYLSKNIIKFIFDIYSIKYQIIYNRPEQENIITDNSKILWMDEKEWIRLNYPDVILADKLYNAHRSDVNNYNHFQLMLYANANRFVSVHGGTSALASYFGGVNIIYSKKGHEHELNEFNTVFSELSGTKIVVCKNEKKLKYTISELL